MKLTNNEMYIKAMDDLISTYAKHNLDSNWIEDVLVNGEWKVVGFQKVDDNCFLLIGTRNWATRYTAASAIEAMAAGVTWYEVTKDEGNEIFKSILKSKRTSKKGKVYYTFNLSC